MITYQKEKKKLSINVAYKLEHLVSRSKPSPGFVCPSVIILGVRYLHVLVKTQDPASDELCHCRPHAQLRTQKEEKKLHSKLRNSERLTNSVSRKRATLVYIASTGLSDCRI